MPPTIQFCKSCRNVLHPREDKLLRKLTLVCDPCKLVIACNEGDYVDNCVEAQNFNYHSVEDITTYIVAGLDKDPTLPRNRNWICANCQAEGAVYFQLPERVMEDAMALVYVCSRCVYFEVKAKADDDIDEDETPDKVQ